MEMIIKNRFSSKQEYLKFKKIWRDAVNDDLARKRIVVKGNETLVEKSWIKAGHHIIFNLLCGKDADYGFSEITDPNKLDNGQVPKQGYVLALDQLIWMFRINPHFRYKTIRREIFMRPFAGFVDEDTVNSLLDELLN